MDIFKRFLNLSYKQHILIAALIRFIFIIYGVYHDEVSTVPYTDIDYKVFTDASRHVLKGESPYNRHTYRYSPLIAIMLIPNVILHFTFGKILFSLVDLIVALLIRTIVKHTYSEYTNFKLKFEIKASIENTLKVEYGHNVRQRRKSKNQDKTEEKVTRNEADYYSDLSMLIWLYNPITIAIATRGNCDSIAGLIVLLTLYFMQCRKNYFLAGILHGIAVHIRLYPICYSLTLFLHLSNYSYYTINRYQNKFKTQPKEIKNDQESKNSVIAIDKQPKRTIFHKEYLYYFVPNLNQINLVTGCLVSLSLLTSIFYFFYGYKFLYETYLYHLIRKDTRHNFSLYFYLQYLTAGVKNIGLWQKVLIVLPQLILLIVFSFRYGLNRVSLNFAILLQTVTMVAYNTVLTSQYFVWILVVLPLCVWQIKISTKTTLFLLIIWFAAQAAWLLPAYFLEFQGQNTFLFIWLQSVSFFSANIAILGRLIMNYMPLKFIEE